MRYQNNPPVVQNMGVSPFSLRISFDDSPRSYTEQENAGNVIDTLIRFLPSGVGFIYIRKRENYKIEGNILCLSGHLTGNNMQYHGIRR